MSDLQAIRKATARLYEAVPIEPLFDGLVVQHPFVNTMCMFNPKTHGFLDLSKQEDVAEHYSIVKEAIYSHGLSFIYTLVNRPWKLTWFRFVKTFLDNEDFAKYLKLCWVHEENPNQDINVSRSDAVDYFKHADKQLLMDESELEHYNNLPENITVYRGVSVGREKYGLSWTDSKDVAEWFMNRFNNEGGGYLLKANISKKNVLAYFNSRDEEELVVDVFAIRKKIEVLTNDYQEYASAGVLNGQ